MVLEDLLDLLDLFIADPDLPHQFRVFPPSSRTTVTHTVSTTTVSGHSHSRAPLGAWPLGRRRGDLGDGQPAERDHQCQACQGCFHLISLLFLKWSSFVLYSPGFHSAPRQSGLRGPRLREPHVQGLLEPVTGPCPDPPWRYFEKGSECASGI